jgi:hypothetical protein
MIFIRLRLAISSKNRGKSGGARVLSFVKVNNTSVLLFSIYDKGERNTVSAKEIKEL